MDKQDNMDSKTQSSEKSSHLEEKEVTWVQSLKEYPTRTWGLGQYLIVHPNHVEQVKEAMSRVTNECQDRARVEEKIKELNYKSWRENDKEQDKKEFEQLKEAAKEGKLKF